MYGSNKPVASVLGLINSTQMNKPDDELQYAMAMVDLRSSVVVRCCHDDLQDPIALSQINHLKREKDQAIARYEGAYSVARDCLKGRCREEYLKAGQIKSAIQQMQQFGKQLGALQQLKATAVQSEDFEVTRLLTDSEPSSTE